MLITATDLCGRVAPTTNDSAGIAETLGLDRDDITWIEDQIIDTGVAFMGEWEFRAAGAA